MLYHIFLLQTNSLEYKKQQVYLLRTKLIILFYLFYLIIFQKNYSLFQFCYYYVQKYGYDFNKFHLIVNGYDFKKIKLKIIIKKIKF